MTDQEQDNDLLAIEVDADDYVDAAAEDTPTVSRTYQSEADFEAIKATYSAKIDGGTTYKDLITAVPILGSRNAAPNGTEISHRVTKVKLSKKDTQLLGYAVAELYYDKDFAAVIELCQRARERCEVDGKTAESWGRWIERCRERMT